MGTWDAQHTSGPSYQISISTRPITSPASSFIKLTITNPLDVAIPITSVTYSVAGSINVGRSPPNTPAINYTRDGGMFLYPPGESVPGINNKYTRVARSSPGVPVPVISADRRRATWSNFQIARTLMHA